MELFVYKFHHKNSKLHVLAALKGFAYILDGIIILITLGFYFGSFTNFVSHLQMKEYIAVQKQKSLVQKKSKHKGETYAQNGKSSKN
jgi:hypothetical protein